MRSWAISRSAQYIPLFRARSAHPDLPNAEFPSPRNNAEYARGTRGTTARNPNTSKRGISGSLAGGICLHFEFCDPAHRSVYIPLGWLKGSISGMRDVFYYLPLINSSDMAFFWLSSTWKIHTTVSKLFSVSLIWTPRTYISTCRTQHFTMSACTGSC